MDRAALHELLAEGPVLADGGIRSYLMAQFGRFDLGADLVEAIRS
jgi:hypothetical protein